MITKTIDEMLEEASIDLTEKQEEYVEVELADGEKITIEKEKFEQLLKENERSDYGEIFY